ncbi:MAG: hypothetical protein IJF39_02090 [Clostridia bacterium]|nr:hypothetical protein [Clostridia bacterium]
MLSDESWNTGFIGIVAARLAEEYNRPTLLFVHHGDMLKGSARSIENINIFTALKACSIHIEEFGGHAQAAGINIKTENFDKLEEALNEEIGRTYTEEDLEQRLYVCEEITARFPDKLSKELAMMEPFGVGHRRPQFVISAGACLARPMKSMSPHLSVRSDFIDLIYFSGIRNLKIIESDVKKQIVFEVNLSHYRGKTQVKGYIRDLLYDGRTGRRAAEGIFSNVIARSRAEGPGVQPTVLTTEETKRLLTERRTDSPYGLCMIASDRRTLRFYEELEEMPCDLFYPSSRNVANLLIVSPAADAELSGFRDIVFLDAPSDYNVASLAGKNVYVNGEICGYKMLEGLDTTREGLLEIYATLRREINRLSGGSAEELADFGEGMGFDRRQFVFALEVFAELGLISFADGKLTVYRGVKAELNDSALYRRVCLLQAE